MADTTKTGGGAETALPPVWVEKFETLLNLTEEIFEQNRAQFLDKMSAFADEHRQATRRPLTADEAVQAAAIMRDVIGEDVLDPAELQNGDLYAWDRPTGRDLLAAGGLGTAPALLDALKRFTVVIESDNEQFLKAVDDGGLEKLIDDGIAGLRRVPLLELRTRTMAALEHLASEAGAGSVGEALRPIIGAVMRALEDSAARVMQQNQPKASTAGS